MRAYFLKTARIGFSAWQAEDLPFAVGLWCDPAVAGMICARGCFTQQEAADRLRLEMENLCRYGVQYYPLFLLENDVFIGCCGLRPGSVPREFELGFHLKPAYWGKGLGFEAAKAAVEYGFSKCHADVICAGHHPKNAGLLGCWPGWDSSIRETRFMRRPGCITPPTACRRRLRSARRSRRRNPENR